jgi:hypothetical protein
MDPSLRTAASASRCIRKGSRKRSSPPREKHVQAVHVVHVQVLQTTQEVLACESEREGRDRLVTIVLKQVSNAFVK